ncbi:hypothetical protein [Streptacidiphilus rugosus]|uniref:hypothetical protein n=1 Tax=Streptacidiphilus rugosus TaxID=405783 RepID=UPI00068F88C0|nr:hypothetical protein [Streptacidiphilus rugosus]
MIRPQATAPQGRSRTRTLYRQVPHTINGRTHTVTEAYEVTVPRPPADWDRIVAAAVTTAMSLFVVASIAWTTASVGALLARTVPAPIGYAAASGFDLAWIICMGLEWLDRHEPDRAAGARHAGHVFLALAMAAVFAHGWLAASIWAGLFGCTISAIAKWLWTLTLARHARPLDPHTQQWYAQEAGQLAAELALTALHRQLNRARGNIAAEQLALAADSQDNDGDSEDSTSGALFTPDTETITDTVRRLIGQGVTKQHLVVFGVQAVHGPDVNAKSVTRILNRELPGGQP